MKNLKARKTVIWVTVVTTLNLLFAQSDLYAAGGLINLGAQKKNPATTTVTQTVGKKEVNRTDLTTDLAEQVKKKVADTAEQQKALLDRYNALMRERRRVVRK